MDPSGARREGHRSLLARRGWEHNDAQPGEAEEGPPRFGIRPVGGLEVARDVRLVGQRRKLDLDRRHPC